MPLTSMRLPKPTKRSKVEADKPPEYPYGLRISLDTDSLKKLGTSVSDLMAGQSVSLTAKAKVVSISASDGEYKSESLDLQITDLSIEGTKKKAGKKAAMTLGSLRKHM